LNCGVIFSTRPVAQQELIQNIDPDAIGCKYAGEERRMVKLKPSQGPGVTVSESAITGIAWGENIGWINFSCLNADTCATVIYGVMNDWKGKLSGYAWCENVGWINFNPANGGVNIGSDGKFTGYAWGENIGWINFSAANACVKTAWTPDTFAPTISLTCPGTVNLNAPAYVTVSVIDERSGVASQSFPNGNNIVDTSTVGAKTFTVTAADNAGNSGSSSCSYQVIYDFQGIGGFGSPLGGPTTVNTAKAVAVPSP
jgi:hypothetical protein